MDTTKANENDFDHKLKEAVRKFINKAKIKQNSPNQASDHDVYILDVKDSSPHSILCCSIKKASF